MAGNTGKPRRYYLEKLFSRRHVLQSGPRNAYCNDEIFKNKVLSAANNMEPCEMAYLKPAKTVEVLVSDLHSSLAIESTAKHPVAVDANILDRKH